MLLLIILISILFTSCSLNSSNIQSDVYLVSLALDYDKMGVNTLSGTLNDQEAIIKQIEFLSESEHRNFYSYQITQKGEKVLYKYYTKQSRGDEIEVIKDITSNNIKNEVKSIFNSLRCKDNDLVIFFYAGHGLGSTEKERLGALVLGDISSISVNSNTYKSLTYYLDELRYDISLLLGNKVIFIDSCHSGALAKNDNVDSSWNLASSYKNLFDKKSIKNDLVWEITACTSDSLSYESSETSDLKAHGKYSKLLLEYLGYKFYVDQVEGTGKPSSKQLSVIDAWKYIRDNLKKNGRQTPVTGLTERDLILFSY